MAMKGQRNNGKQKNYKTIENNRIMNNGTRTNEKIEQQNIVTIKAKKVSI